MKTTGSKGIFIVKTDRNSRTSGGNNRRLLLIETTIQRLGKDDKNNELQCNVKRTS